VLAPKDSSNYQTLEKGIVNRNRSIQEYLWQKLLETAAQTGEALPDIVIFHENDIPSELQKKVKEDTPDLRIIFRKIKNFNLAKYDNKTGKFKLNYAKCPEGYRSEITPVGYKDMCRFWSLGFLDYVREYDWVFRFDDDCEISEILDASMFSSLFNPDVFISAPGWQPLNRQRFDLVDLTQKTQGVVVQGLLSFTQDFVNRYSPEAKGKVIHSMMAPYTNAMYINLKWLRAGEQFERKQHKSSSTVSKQIYQAHLILEFLKAVDESNCIYTNRSVGAILLYYYTTILLYCYTAILLYYYTTILLYYYTAILLYYYTAMLPYCYTAILLYCYTTILLYYYTAILLYYYTAILLYYYTAILLYCYTAIINFQNHRFSIA
jgi:hypothetical protein